MMNEATLSFEIARYVSFIYFTTKISKTQRNALTPLRIIAFLSLCSIHILLLLQNILFIEKFYCCLYAIS